MVALFSYGTLQQREVQLATYGRELVGTPDVLAGYRLAPLAITDPRVVRISGKAVHSIASASGNPAHRLTGTLFQITEAELGATDAYEVDAYQRDKVTLESGRTAFVYVGRPSKT
ncbi:MAG: gamma-glutamylcyclotransferase family protein [Sphingomicrobium sp.]